MSIYGALFSGVSGLAAQSQALGTIADNVTSVNTNGYKETRSEFSTLVTSARSISIYPDVIVGGIAVANLAIDYQLGDDLEAFFDHITSNVIRLK